jgi:hypothetical protein
MFLCAIAFLIGCLVLFYCVKMVTDVMRVDRQLFVQSSAAAAARGVIAEFSSSTNEPLRAQFLASAHDVASHIGAGIAEGYGTPPRYVWRRPVTPQSGTVAPDI